MEKNKKAKNEGRKGNPIKNYLLMIIALLAVFVYAYFNGDSILQTPQSPQSSQPITEELTVTFIDIGQGDSELIQLGGSAVLIDSGESDKKQKVIDTLNASGVKQLDYVIASHPHSDHMGSMSAVIDYFDVLHVMMPNKTANTASFEKLLKSIKNKGLTIERPQPGGEITAGNIKLEILAPNESSYTDTNNYSIVCKLVYGQTSFLFTGDAEALSEKEILAKGYDVSSTVLKAGHHGSTTSTSSEFLAAVSPEMAVISCAAGNSYGHPHKETLEKFEAAGVKVYRTDISGTIVMHSDGSAITVETEK